MHVVEIIHEADKKNSNDLFTDLDGDEVDDMDTL